MTCLRNILWTCGIKEITKKIADKLIGNHDDYNNNKSKDEKENDDTMDYDVMWMFFNCDEHVSWGSMNPLYNSTVYRKRAGRRALWKKIKDEVAAGNVIISEDKMSDVRQAIIGGDPLVANEFMKYGFIVALDEAA